MYAWNAICYITQTAGWRMMIYFQHFMKMNHFLYLLIYEPRSSFVHLACGFCGRQSDATWLDKGDITNGSSTSPYCCRFKTPRWQIAAARLICIPTVWFSCSAISHFLVWGLRACGLLVLLSCHGLMLPIHKSTEDRKKTLASNALTWPKACICFI